MWRLSYTMYIPLTSVYLVTVNKWLLWDYLRRAWQVLPTGSLVLPGRGVLIYFPC